MLTETLLATTMMLLAATLRLRVLCVKTGSMAPTLEVGDILLATRYQQRLNTLRANSIVAFSEGKSQGNPRTAKLAVKRVAALSRVVVDAETGKPMTRPPSTGPRGRSDSRVLEIPPESIYVIGDNRSVSLDSRHYGPVALASVQAIVHAIIWPPERFHLLGRRRDTCPK